VVADYVWDDMTGSINTTSFELREAFYVLVSRLAEGGYFTLLFTSPVSDTRRVIGSFPSCNIYI
jgi:hypothetical protein